MYAFKDRPYKVGDECRRAAEDTDCSLVLLATYGEDESVSMEDADAARLAVNLPECFRYLGDLPDAALRAVDLGGVENLKAYLLGGVENLVHL